MTERGKAIKALECNLNFAEVAGKFDCEQCGYECRKTMFLSVPVNLLVDALALLKAQAPRVMTLEEALESDFCWLETHGWHSGDYFAPVLRSQTLDDESGRTFIDQNDDLFGFKDSEYGVTCRCWTSRPTKEQREATAWQG